MSLDCPIGMKRLSCNSEEMARSSCDLEMDRSSYSSESTEHSTCGSDVVMINDLGLQTIRTPIVKYLNAVNSSIVVEPQFLTVTQNVQNINVVKDLSFHRYIWNVVRNATKVEKMSCGTAMFVLFVSIMLIIYFAVIANNINENIDTESDWFITREEWLAIEYNKTVNTTHNRLVIIAHTTGATCDTFVRCKNRVKSIQSYFINSYDSDIPYSFLIGGDGRVYEGRGWNIVGAHTYGYNNCSTGLAFIGDYREGLPSYANVTVLQQQRAHMLFKEGVKNGHLHPNFHVLGAKDLRLSESPGTKLYKAIRKWPNYDHENLYKGKSCRQIREFFENENATSAAAEIVLFRVAVIDLYLILKFVYQVQKIFFYS